MRIKSVELVSFKRFTHLKLGPIPSEARLVILVGPNGSGKSSILEAFNHWRTYKAWSSHGDENYLRKTGSDLLANTGNWYSHIVDIEFHPSDNPPKAKQQIYSRPAYRNEPDFRTAGLNTVAEHSNQSVPDRFILNESAVSQNYNRLVGRTLQGVFEDENGEKKVSILRDEIIGRVRTSLLKVFPDLTLSSIGQPLSDGTFFFTKGTSKDFRYKNLSAGEKSVFDLLLDLAVNLDSYPEAIFAIDEPEAHIHTEKQGVTLRSIYELIPSNGQLWCSTHSLGMLMEAYQLEKANPGTVTFLDLSDRDFDVAQVISASQTDAQLWQKILELSLGTLGRFVGPSIIYLCEGDSNASEVKKSFDAQVLTRIFGSTNPYVTFVSVGNADSVKDKASVTANSIRAIFPKSEIRRFIDRDERSQAEVDELIQDGVRVSSLRHIECYLLSEEAIELLCHSISKDGLVEAALKVRSDVIAKQMGEGKSADDLKWAARNIRIALLSLLQLKNSGGSTHAFLRDTMAPLLKPGTKTYELLKTDLGLSD